MAEGNGTPTFRPRSGRDLFMVPQSDRLNDQFRLVDTLVLSMTDSWAYLPPRAKHILWLKLASCDRNFLEQCGMPLENGILLHWSMWPDDLGDYAQAVSLRSSRQQLEYLEPKNVAMASAIRQAEMAENTSRLQIQLAQILLRLSQNGADPNELAKLFSKDRFDKESIKTVLMNAEQAEQEIQIEAAIPQPMAEPIQQEGVWVDSTDGPVYVEAEPEHNTDVGECSECGTTAEYVKGEDEHGPYMIDICYPCYEKLRSDEEGEPIYDESDIDALLQTMDDGPTNDEELMSLSEQFENYQEENQMLNVPQDSEEE
jgi:hypothetical protein